VRWQHPQRGLLAPSLFIPVAERFGLIGALGDWVIGEACRQVRTWMDEGLRVRVAINLSVHQLRQDDLVQRVKDALAHHRIEPGQLTFEITESVAMDDEGGTLRAFENLSNLGVKLAIDDFGTGYSSLAYLKHLALDKVKIDQIFVHGLPRNELDGSISRAIVTIGHELGLRVVAEGVETTAQAEFLSGIGCDELQGYLLGKPAPASEVEVHFDAIALQHAVSAPVFRPAFVS
jgi:EAL domain-containing protein (putative c-di-GMP-specific phosphodiesterase class I)